VVKKVQEAYFYSTYYKLLISMRSYTCMYISNTERSFYDVNAIPTTLT